jgi:hypothetical protein
LKLILIADGETDYLLMKKIMLSDSDLSILPIQLIKPEDVGLHRRTGGGHKTLLSDALHAAQAAAQGRADGVFVLVDNDGDARFSFPHYACDNCRECEAKQRIASITWGRPFLKEASILFQAAETILLSVRPSFNTNQECMLYSAALKTELYGRQINDLKEMYEAFSKELQKIKIVNIKAKCYFRIKNLLIKIADSYKGQ